jgi:hypothetical protein
MPDPRGKPEPVPEVPLLIQGLIGELPARGQPFPRAARERWMAALKVNLDLIYGDDDKEWGTDA